MTKLFIEERHKKLLLDIFKALAPETTIWAYGSRVNGTAHEGSDLDLVIVNDNDGNFDYTKLKEAINESNVPFLVDLLQLSKLPESFQDEIKQNYLEFYNGQN